MHSCLRQQARRHSCSHTGVGKNLVQRLSAPLNGHSAVRIQGSRWKSSESVLWSDQGIEPVSLLEQKTTSAAAAVNKVPESSKQSPTSSYPSTPSHLKSMGQVPPKGVETLPTPTNQLPVLPRKPPYPCPHLSDLELDVYLRPLYERGWGIFTRAPVRDGTDGPPTAHTLMLAKDLKFIWHAGLVDFLTTLNTLTKRENHHPRVAYEFRALELRIQTHDATLRDARENGSSGSLDPSPPSSLEGSKLPGITLRDVRLAYLIEDALQPYYDLGKLTFSNSRGFAQPRSLREFTQINDNPAAEMERKGRSKRREGEAVESERQGSCRVCGGDHWSTKCPKRFIVKPSVPCDLCGGDHWRFTCLLYKEWKAMVKRGNGATRLRVEGDP